MNEIKDPNDKKNKLKVKSLIKQIETLKIETEMKNPEVLYNVEYGSVENIDTTQPIYRKLLKEKWKDYDLMLLMQRLEQLHVIPDTLPTLDPKVDVKVKFSHNVEEEFKIGLLQVLFYQLLLLQNHQLFKFKSLMNLSLEMDYIPYC